ncbi:hypothetical protein Hdeb2414_s0014g00426741 [Helianthus debilis subsp. tardiflorus]
MTFFLAELSTSGSEGWICTENFEGILMRHMTMLSAMVARGWIKRLDKILLKESRLFFLR